MTSPYSPKKSAIKTFSFVGFLLLGSFIFLMNNQNYLGLFFFLVAIVISAIVTISYFLYFSFYYRWARWGLASIATLIGALVVYFYWDEIKTDITEYYSNLTLPDKFRSYQTLTEQIPYTKNGKTINYLNPDSNGFLGYDDKLFLNDKNQLIFFDDNRYMLKFNTQGIAIDTLYLKNEGSYYTLVGDYYLNTSNNFYYSWAIDGDTLRKPITFLEDSTDWDNQQRTTFFNELQTTADYLYLTEIHFYDLNISDSLQKERGNDKVFFCKNKQWSYFYFPKQGDDFYYDSDNYGWRELSKGKNKDLLSSFAERAATETETRKRGAIRPQYVSYTNELYLNIVIDGVTINAMERRGYYQRNETLLRPTIYLSNSTESIEDFENIKLYTNKNLQYKLLSDNERVYIVY